jgi:hypothetical protein
VRFGLPAFFLPCFGFQKSILDTGPFVILQQCPTKRSLLSVTLTVILGMSPVHIAPGLSYVASSVH